MDVWSWRNGWDWGKYLWEGFRGIGGIFIGYEGWVELVEERKGDDRRCLEGGKEYFSKRFGRVVRVEKG